MASERFSVEAMVHGYHIYKDVWKTAVVEGVLLHANDAFFN